MLPGPAVMITPKVMLSVTATLLSVVPSRGQSRLAGCRQIGFPSASVFVTSIQIRSTVALALATPANPMRATALLTAAVANAVNLIIAPTPQLSPVWAQTEIDVKRFRLW